MDYIALFLQQREEERLVREKEGDSRPRCVICKGRLYIGNRRCKRTGRVDNEVRCIDCMDLKQMRFLGALIDVDKIEDAVDGKTVPTPPVVEPDPFPEVQVEQKEEQVERPACKCGRKLRSNNKKGSCNYCVRPWLLKKKGGSTPLEAKVIDLPMNTPKRKEKKAPKKDGLRYGMSILLRSIFSGDIGKANEWTKYLSMAYPVSDIESVISKLG
jgi:hypothetical protein